ncbi:oligosaccharide flippase family protein [Bacillus carboniphilus]|uniref:Oligosaccharide flippase family protein n=1 Tax=Bacillus carboniphilus TaxID=86663 RepID=A0ABY9JY95_9BACI|nr:oligosaccharide flippase family protein [Bacillus carboniphilus]WLR44320.1 oligosaccharide flippase family protein [Bacillus carboniphilus]
MLVATYLGKENYGVLAVALSFAAIAGYFTELGLTQTLVREGTKKGSNHNVIVSSFFTVRIILAILTIIVSIFIINFFYSDPLMRYVLFVSVIPTIVGAALQGLGTAYFLLIEEMKYTALIKAITGLTTAVSLFAGIIFQLPLEWIAPIYGVANILAGIVAYSLVRKRIKLFSGWDRGIIHHLPSFMISGLTVLLLAQVAPIIMEKVTTKGEVGTFSLAFKIPSLLYQVPGIVAMAFFPILFRLGNEKSWNEHRRTNTIQLKVMSFLGISIVLPLFLYSDYLIGFLDPSWDKTATVLKILSFLLLLQSINYPLADGLTTSGQQIKRTMSQLVALGVAVILYIILGREYGSIGGAIAAISTEATMMTLFIIFYRGSIKVLFDGAFINFVTFIMIILGSFYINISMHPLVEMVLVEILFVSFVLMVDSPLRKYIYSQIQIIRKKLF